MLLPKPEAYVVVEAVTGETEAAKAELAPHVGTLSRAAERTLRVLMARAIELGINLQREAAGLGVDQSRIHTPVPSSYPQHKASPDEVTRKVKRPV